MMMQHEVQRVLTWRAEGMLWEEIGERIGKSGRVACAMTWHATHRTAWKSPVTAGPPGRSERPVLIVDYDWETGKYYLAEKESGKRTAGPFATMWQALEFARSSIALER